MTAPAHARVGEQGHADRRATRPWTIPLPMGLARAALDRLLRRTVRSGALTVILPGARPIIVGDGSAADAVTVRVRDARTALRLAL